MHLLEIRDLKKYYFTPERRRHAVVSVKEFFLPGKSQTALHGESGSGKTTLLHLIAGILQADSGSILIGGKDIASMDEFHRDEMRGRHIGYVFQTFNLLQGYSALENLLLAMSFAGKTDSDYAKRLLQRVGLGERMDYKPRQLSTGQQQRVAIARALANHPRLILADEPTGNLDPANAREVIRLIREMCSETSATLLLVSHDPEVLKQFDNVVELASINRPVLEGSAQ